MAQTGFTPLSLYYSATATNVPLAANLVAGELALNTADGKLFYKDSSNVVQVIGTKGGVGSSTTTQVLYNSSGLVVGSANMTFNGTILTSTGFAGPLNGTVGATTANTGAFTTLTTSSTVTLNGGTANGVAYLNGSKVLTTGSALTFDGTNLAAGRLLSGRYTSDANGWGIQNYSAASAYASGIQMVYGGVGAAAIWVPAASALAFGADGGAGTTEQMRLTSTGLGIGTSSPQSKLTIAGVAPAASSPATYQGTIQINETALSTLQAVGGLEFRGAVFGSGYGAKITSSDTGDLLFGNRSNSASWTETMRLVGAGNLGLGVTPSAWNSVYRSIQLGIGASISGRSDENTWNELLSNAYRNTSGGWTYLNTDYASSYRMATGAHAWYTAPAWNGTGSDAISFTQAMTLDASGNLLVGTTSAINGTTLSVDAGAVRNGIGVDIDSTTPGGYTGLYINRTATNGDVCSFAVAGAAVGSISVTTLLTTYNTTSDYRLKTVIGAVVDSGSRIDALQPVEYEWKADGSRTRGFLAHQFQEVYASSVTGTKDAMDAEGKPKYQAMQASSSEVIADLVAEIQDLRKRLAAAGI